MASPVQGTLLYIPPVGEHPEIALAWPLSRSVKSAWLAKWWICSICIAGFALFGIAGKAFAGTEAATGPNSPVLTFKMATKWLTPAGMILQPGETYRGKRYPRNVALNVAGIQVVVPSDSVVVVVDSSATESGNGISIQELKAKEQIQQRDKQQMQVSNPDFYDYSTGKMSAADRGKLEKEAKEAGMSVEEYTKLNGMNRYKARQSKN
jgi:hypothetical protein